MNFLVKIKDLLYKDVSSENELKEMAVLLRVLCITDAVFYTISAIVFFLIFGSKEGILSLVFVLTMLIILRTTYKNSTRISLFLYSFILAMIVIFYCALFGTQIGYQFSLYTVILLFFYKTDESTAFKMSSSIVCGLLAVVTSVYIDIVGPVNQLKNSQEVVLLCIYSLWLLSKIIIISRFYCLKFSASEDKIIQYAKKLEHLATIDTLTQLQNRRGMMNHLRKLADSYSSTNYPFSLVISDIDLFKKVNDTYGHDTGDYVLANLAVILKDFMRDKGRVARWGGEEFLFVFEGKNGDYVFEELNKLKFLIEKSIFTYKDYSFSITMTFGLEEFDSNTGIEKTIEKADEKLYQGKEHGRNCVVY